METHDLEEELHPVNDTPAAEEETASVIAESEEDEPEEDD